VIISGIGPRGARIQVFVDDELVGSTDVRVLGIWRFRYRAEPGVHTIQAQAAGQPNAPSPPVTITIGGN